MTKCVIKIPQICSNYVTDGMQSTNQIRHSLSVKADSQKQFRNEFLGFRNRNEIDLKLKFLSNLDTF